MTIIEFIAFLFGVGYLFGISSSKRWGWILGIINATLYVFVCLKAQLFIQAGLQSLYIVFGIYGFIVWGKDSFANVKSWALKKHLVLFLISSVFGILFGYVLSHNTSQQVPFLDAYISLTALLATYLTTQHVIENWYYWIIINSCSIVLFTSQELYITAGMFFVNLCMSLWGLYQWKITSQIKT